MHYERANRVGIGAVNPDFVEATRSMPSTSLRSIATLQRNVRRVVRKLLARKVLLQRAWVALETVEENELVDAHTYSPLDSEDLWKAVSSILKGASPSASLDRKSIKSKEQVSISQFAMKEVDHHEDDINSPICVPTLPEVVGRALLFPLTLVNGVVTNITREWVTALMDEVARGGKVDAANVDTMLRGMGLMHVSQSNVTRVQVHPRGKITVVGDIHGQLDDLLTILKLNGLPSPVNQYIFNGDWVDRGPNSCEVVLLIFAWKLLMPNSVFLNRGNHEVTDLNSRDGFKSECIRKYSQPIYDLFSNVFAVIPLATVISPAEEGGRDPIFVCHGGVSQGRLTLAEINKWTRAYPVYQHGDPCTDLLWCDPQDEPGVCPSERGMGYTFGPDVTRAFLATNKLSMIVRSHEWKDQGAEVHHDGQLITVFSASNYQGTCANHGAFLTFDNDLKPVICTFWADPKTARVPTSTHCARLHQAIVAKLRDRIATFRLDLQQALERVHAFEYAALKNPGSTIIASKVGPVPKDEPTVVSRKGWAIALAKVLNLAIEEVPCEAFAVELGVSEPPGTPLDYTAFLRQYNTLSQLYQGPKGKTSSRLQRMESSEGAPKSPTDTVSSASSSTSSAATVRTVSSSSGFPGVKEGDAEGEMSAALGALSALLAAHKHEMGALFRHMDKDGNGVLSYTEFASGLYGLIQAYYLSAKERAAKASVQAASTSSSTLSTSSSSGAGNAESKSARLETSSSSSLPAAVAMASASPSGSVPDTPSSATTHGKLSSLDAVAKPLADYWTLTRLTELAGIVDADKDGNIVVDEFVSKFGIDSRGSAAGYIVASSPDILPTRRNSIVTHPRRASLSMTQSGYLPTNTSTSATIAHAVNLTTQGLPVAVARPVSRPATPK